MTIGVFDSGIGGEAFVKPLAVAFPEAEITVVNDKAHVPYGLKTTEAVRKLTDTAIQPLLGMDVILIACNTATASAIDFLRNKYPDQHFVGLDPMIKPAATSTTSGIIAICATPATLASERYQNLKQQYASSVTVIEPDCSDWAELIEHNRVNQENIIEDLQPVLESDCDTLALACTHYHWIRDLLDKITGQKITIIDPTNAVIEQIERVLKT